MKSFAEEYFVADSARYNAREAIELRLDQILDPEASQDDLWDDLCFDPCDWDGTSIEFMGALEGVVPTSSQLDQIWELGFTVVRIWYKQIEGSTWSSGRMSGDWWCVKGRPPRQCAHTVEAKS